VTFRVGYDLKGFDAMRAELLAIPDKVAKPAMLGGLFAARGLLVRAAKAGAPRGTEPTRKTRRNRGGDLVVYDYGRLRANILGEVKGQGGASRRAIAAGASPARGLFLPRVRVYTGSAFWGRLIETGYTLKRWRRNGPAIAIRRVAARPWFYRSIEGQRDAVRQRIADELRKRIDRARAKGRI
jgi:hypothetical protein